jgi:Contractile injection system tape measure protein
VKQKHFIGKLSLTVQAARLQTATAGFDLQADISELVHTQLKHALETLFDQFVPPHEVLKIDQLDIVIPPLSFNDWEKELTPSVIRAIEEALERLLHFPTAHSLVSKNKIEKTSVEQSLFEAWLFFLKTGQMPQIASSETEWQTVSLAAVAANAQSVEILRGLLNNNPAVLERLVLQHTDTFLEALAEAISGKKQAETVALLQTFEALWLDSSFIQYLKNTEPITRTLTNLTQRDIRETFWKLVFKQLAQGMAVSDFPLFIKTILEQLFTGTWRKEYISFLLNIFVFKKAMLPKKAKGASLKRQAYEGTSSIQELDPLFMQAIKKAAIHPSIAQRMIDFFKKEIRQQENNLTSKTTTPTATDLAVESKIKDNKVASSDEETTEETEDHNTTLLQETNLVAANAGVVLLHPFLKPFFQSLNLLKEGTFKTLKARRRAAALIHYLATGTTEMAEYDMALPKLLVGLPLQKPLDRHLILTETERTEAEGLLRAVVSHWKALGSTSPAGLREGFLQRTGKLTHRDDGWLLQIEAKTLDILMDRLPWGLSIIRFGWMPKMLFVEWH